MAQTRLQAPVRLDERDYQSVWRMVAAGREASSWGPLLSVYCGQVSWWSKCGRVLRGRMQIE